MEGLFARHLILPSTWQVSSSLISPYCLTWKRAILPDLSHSHAEVECADVQYGAERTQYLSYTGLNHFFDGPVTNLGNMGRVVMEQSWKQNPTIKFLYI